MTYAITFNEEAIKSIERDYVRVHIKPAQLKLIQQISNILCKQINIPRLAMRGITWYALKEWQIENDMTIAQITEMDIVSRIFIAKQIFNIGKERLKDILAYPKDQSEVLLDIAFEKSFKILIEYLNRTRF